MEVYKEEYTKLLKVKLDTIGTNEWRLTPVAKKDGSPISRGVKTFKGDDEELKQLLRKLKARDHATDPPSEKNRTYQTMIDNAREKSDPYVWVYLHKWSLNKENRTMDKENIIEITKEVEIPGTDFVLEEGDRIQIIPKDEIQERKMYSYIVYLNGKEIDKVFYKTYEEPEEVQRSLINHDGYDPRIMVKFAESEENKEKTELSERINARTEQAIIRAFGEEGAENVRYVGKSPYEYGFEFEGEGLQETEWLVFESEKDAEREAIAMVRDDMASDPEMFNIDFLKKFIMVRPGDIHIIATEEADAVVGYEGEEGVDEREWNKVYNDVMKSLERDPVDYFVNELGAYSLEDLLQQSFIMIDEEDASEEAVRLDGADHFLDRYDGEAIELSDADTRKKFFAYGIN